MRFSGAHIKSGETVQIKYRTLKRIVFVGLSSLIIGSGLALSGAVSASSLPMATVKDGKKSLTVRPARNLDPNAATIRVIGRNFDPRVGIYVALCVTPAKGSLKAPGPCGGGINMSGRNPASEWISSNAPSYGQSLAKPFNKRGGFSVRLTISPMIGEIDCRTTACSISTRADHTRSTDRSADMFVPVTFRN